MGQGMMIDNDGYLMPDYEDDDSDMEEKYVTNLKEKQIPKLKSVVCFEFPSSVRKKDTNYLLLYSYFGNDESAFWNDRGDDNKGKKSSGGSSNNKKRKKEGGGGPKTTKMISMEVVGADGYTYTIKKKVT